jgi:beta-glucanase (GH16 family)
MQNLIVLFVVLALCLVNAQYWKQVWSDEFEGTAVDLKKWQFEEKCNVHNNELQCYTSRTQNARVANGKLSIAALLETYGNKRFTSARLNTAKTASWLYGRFEMSARLPRGRHLWPAFWMLPTDYKFGTWAASGEIDIMEYRGQETNITQGTLHYGGMSPNNARHGSGSVTMGTDLSRSYNLYAVEWEKDEIRWYFNNRMYYKTSLVRSFYSGRGTNPYTTNRQPFDQRFNIVINLAVGGNFFNAEKYGAFAPEDARQWESNTFDIDYIRVYEPSTTPPVNTSATVRASTAAPTQRQSSATTPRQSVVITEESSADDGGVVAENNLEGNSAEQANPKILGMTKSMAAGVFVVIGVLVIAIVVLLVATIFYKRRAGSARAELRTI